MTCGQIGLIILLAMGDVLMQGHPFSFDSSHKAGRTVASAVIRGEHRTPYTSHCITRGHFALSRKPS